MSFLLFGIVIIVLLYINDRVKNKKLYELSKKFPGPLSLPLVGNTKDFLSDSHGIFMTLLDFVTKYERFYRVWNGGKFYLICYDYKDAEVILGSTTHLKKSESYKFIHPWIGENILTGSGQLWRSHRKVITPAFHFKILNQFLEVFNRKTEIFCEKLAEKAGKGPFDIYKDVKLLALDNIYETAMGFNMDVQRNSESEYVQAVKNMCHVANQRIFKVWLMIDFIFKLSGYAKIQEKALKVLHQATNDVIRRRGLGRPRNTITETEDPDENTQKKRAFLDLLQHSPEVMTWSQNEIRREVDTFLFAGHDTVSSGLGFAFYCLAHNPEVQEKVYEEQVKIFGNSSRLPTADDIHEMKYLERVIKEVQRIYPSVPIIGRELETDLELPGKLVVPKGTQLSILICSIHKDPRVWKNPNEFNPDNFLPEAIASRPHYTYIPFSAGPRNCLGQKYAMLEMKSTIGILCRKFRFLPSLLEEHKLRLASEIILVSKTGIHVRVEKRV
ncbi:UNVERIFIED_CONTAM: hypothetical protein PYX00_001197 [Menopon gallinae]|uniref:Cytochrome P450 n=1 Tax=Menopon gallinae TaxID=328185 RepID=A0AAW2ID75_9NEOP